MDRIEIIDPQITNMSVAADGVLEYDLLYTIKLMATVPVRQINVTIGITE